MTTRHPNFIRVAIVLCGLFACSLESAQSEMISLHYGIRVPMTPENEGLRRDPSDVIKVGDTWHVWYSKSDISHTGDGADIWHSSSTDEGETWVEHGEAVARGSESINNWDYTSAFTPNILFLDGTYYMYYTGTPLNWETDYHPEGIKAIGVATASSPYGPWTKYEGNPVLRTTAVNSGKFDNYLIDDAALAVRNGAVWLYYKGRHRGSGPKDTQMGVAVSDSPLGPFVRQNNGNPVQTGGHEVSLWMDDQEGIYSVVNKTGPAHLINSLQYAANGLDFSRVCDAEAYRFGIPANIKASGFYRPELNGPASDKYPSWGIAGVSQLQKKAVRFTSPNAQFSGDALGYDLTGAEVAAFRSTGVSKSNDADEDNIYGTAGYFFYGNGSDNSSNADGTPTWITDLGTSSDVSVDAAYDDFDDPTTPTAADVPDWTHTGIGRVSNSTAGAWSELLTFKVDSEAPNSIRLGVITGNENSADGSWDPSGLRVLYKGIVLGEVDYDDGSFTGEVTTLGTELGMVFFDIELPNDAEGVFSIEGQTRDVVGVQGVSIAGVVFDDSSISSDDAFYYDTYGDGNLSVNADVGGGLSTDGAGNGAWSESGGALVWNRPTNGGARANGYTNSSFDLSEGFILEVDFTIGSYTTDGNQQFSFGVVEEYVADVSQRNSFTAAAANDAGIGFEILTGGAPVLRLVEAGETASTFTTLSALSEFSNGSYSLSLTIIPDGSGGVDWSYSLDDGTAVTGNIASYTFAPNYAFVAHARDDETSKTIQEVRLLKLPGTASEYDVWSAGHGLTGDDALATADIENGGVGDGYTNLMEFALGMDPTVWDAGSRESHATVDDEGTEYFEYMHYRRTDYVALGLSYDILDSETLLDFGDSINAQDEVSFGPAVDGYEPVFNRYLLDVPTKFFQLRVQQD